MWTMRGNGMRAIAIGLFVAASSRAGMAATPPAPYDFTGEWTGMVQRSGRPALSVTANLTGVKTFTGTVTVEDTPPNQCTVTTGRQRAHLKVRMRLTCDDGTVAVLHGKLDSQAGTLTGGFTQSKHGKTHGGTFTLTKQPA